MKVTLKKLAILFAVLLMLPVFNIQTSQAATAPDTKASAALAFDEKTGQILYSENANKKVAIGSITKILTLYLVTKAIHQNNLSFKDELKPTEQQAAMTQHDELTNVSLEANKKYSVRELYDAAWIVSSNSAAMMLAQKVGGTEINFIELMRKTLKSWGIRDAEIYNVSGLNNSYLDKGMYLGSKDAENKLSASDIAIIAKHILDEYPEVLKTTSQSELTFPDNENGKKYKSLNLLLKGNRDYQAGYEFDGLKTGTTKQAGDSFVGTYPVQDTRIVTIVMDVHGEANDKDKRFRSTQNLAHYINDNFENKVILKKGQQVILSKRRTFKTYKDVHMWAPNGFNVNSLTYKKSSTSNLGFNVANGKKQAKIVVKNMPGGYIYYPHVKHGIKKIKPKKTKPSIWTRIGDFFKHLF